MLFLVHAYGSRLWRPGDVSRQQGHVSPSEHSYQAPAGTPKLYMDGPWRLQWPCLIPWALVQAAHSVAWLRNAASTSPWLTALCPACCCCAGLPVAVAGLPVLCCAVSRWIFWSALLGRVLLVIREGGQHGVLLLGMYMSIMLLLKGCRHFADVRLPGCVSLSPCRITLGSTPCPGLLSLAVKTVVRPRKSCCNQADAVAAAACRVMSSLEQ